MLNERIKSSVIWLLIINLIFLTCRLWFNNSLWHDSLLDMAMNLPILRNFRSSDVSIPRERLSAPQKILINDGALWIAYYNTDAVFEPIENRTRGTLQALLRGEYSDKREIGIEGWQKALESVSVYVEYPITYTVDMLCAVMSIPSGAAPHDVGSLKDFIIIPSGGESEVYIILRDASAERAYIYRLGDSAALSRDELAIYTENNSGYYEPAFSTGVEPEGVELNPMVLFSDSRPPAAVLAPINPLLSRESLLGALETFSNNINTAGSYPDSDGVVTYVENYSNIRVYPNGLFEYEAVSADKGIEITDRYSSDYETVNAAISFAENLWMRVDGGPLSVLVTSDLGGDNSNKLRLTMDYYYDGRPVAVSLDGAGRFARLDHGIEMVIENGRITSYRQLFRSYEPKGSAPPETEFVGALDYFVNTFSSRKGTVIDDIYIGYMDTGASGELFARWLAKLDGDDATYASENPAREVMTP